MKLKAKNTSIFALLTIILIVCSILVLMVSIQKSESQEVYADTTHNHDGYTAWTSTNSLPSSGSYYLTTDVTVGGSTSINSGTLNLCLNGYGIKTTSGRIFTLNGGTLNLYDCGTTTHFFNLDSNGMATNVNSTSGAKSFTGGYLTGGNGPSGVSDHSYYWGEGGAILVWTGTFNMYGGTLIGNYAGHGAAVEIVNATMNMYGGQMIYNRCGQGGAALNVRSQSGNSNTFNMYGGKMSYNVGTALDASYCYGAAHPNIYAGEFVGNTGWGISIGRDIKIDTTDTNGTVTITDNKAGGVNFGGANLSLKGNVTILNNTFNDKGTTRARNVYVNSGKAITIAGALTGNIGVFLRDGLGTFTNGWSANMGEVDPHTIFSSDEDYYVLADNGELGLVEVVAQIGDTVYSTLLDAYNAAQENDTIILLKNVDITSLGDDVYINVEKTIGLDLNGHILTFTDGQILLSESSVLTIDNSAPATGGIKGAILIEDVDSYVLLKNTRLIFSIEMLEQTLEVNHIANGFEALNINSNGSADQNCFIVIVTDEYAFDSFVWSDDGTSAQAKFVSKVDDTDIKYVQATMTNTTLTEPTCLDKGTMQCDAKYFSYTDSNVADIDPLGHDYSDWILDCEPGCVTNGHHHKECSRCDSTIEEDIDPIGHDYSDWILDYEPTCAGKGHQHKECSRCDSIIREDIEPIGHIYEFDSFVWNDTYSRAKAQYKCTRDEDHVIKYDAQITVTIVKESTLEEEGVKRFTATYDTYTESKDVAIPVKQEEIKKDIVSVKIDGDESFDSDISLKVVVKTEVKSKEVEVDYAKVQAKLEKKESIVKVYDVKLIRTINGVKEVIQPSDIKEGTKVIVRMKVPEGIDLGAVRILHIHSADDMEFVENYKVVGNEIEFEVDRFSEFAFITKNPSHGFCVCWVAFILVMLEMLCACVYAIIRFGLFKDIVAKMKLDLLYEKLDELGTIGEVISSALFLFALIAVCVHPCAIAAVSFVFATIICGGFTYFFMMDKDVVKQLKQEI